jgi:hypothetical protein
MSFPTKEARQLEYEGNSSFVKKYSATYIDSEPDFDNFTKEHWMEYQQKQDYEASQKKTGVIAWLVVAIICILGYYW